MVAKDTTSCQKIPQNLGSQRYHSLSEKIPNNVSYHSLTAKIPFFIHPILKNGKDTMSSSEKIPRNCPIIVGAQRYHFRRQRYDMKGDLSLQNERCPIIVGPQRYRFRNRRYQTILVPKYTIFCRKRYQKRCSSIVGRQ